MKSKLYCVFSKSALRDLKGVRGKMVSQSGHAFLHAFWDAENRFPDIAEKYKKSDHAYKITGVVDTDLELQKLVNLKQFYGYTEVVDSGFTVLNGPRLTCIGIGPVEEKSEYSEHLKNLQLLT